MRPGERGRAAASAELAVDPDKVVLDGRPDKEHPLRDGPIAQALRRQPQNLQFTFAESSPGSIEVLNPWRARGDARRRR